MSRWLHLLAGLVLVAGLRPIKAQQQQPVAGWELPGLDISPDGGWRVKAGAVAALRSSLLAQRRFAALNAGSASPAGAAAVAGTLRVPVIMFRYQDSPPAQYQSHLATDYDATLFGQVAPNGKPYTLRTFYEQLSNGVFSIQGQSFGWVPLSKTEVNYTGGANCAGQNPHGTSNCNGIYGIGFADMQSGLIEALQHADSFIDFGQFDNDGPDGIPNSADDDGFVDAVLFVHPSMDGACVSSSNGHLWSHRSQAYYVTNDSATPGPRKTSSHIIVRDYILQSGLGGTSGVCDSTQIMPIGTAAHELGHILALPDLYDTQGSTQGIGEWGLMGSGNYTSSFSPSRYDAWSLQQMGWTTVAPLTSSGAYSVGPVPTADTTFYVGVSGANPRNEYFLLENRQGVLADSAMIRIHGGGGLLVWHVDGAKACLISLCSANVMNSGPIHGLALEEADGKRQLWCESQGCNRGDAGDPYPGSTGNPKFAFDTKPAAVKNSDSSFVGFTIDSITVLVPNGAMSFHLRFGGLTVVRAADTAATVQVDSKTFAVFRNVLDSGSAHVVSFADSQVSSDSGTRFYFTAWSDGGARTHTILGTAAGDTLIAAATKGFRVAVTVGAHGVVAFSPSGVTNGTYVNQGTPVTLQATPDSQYVFGAWSGDTTTGNASVVLPMARPYRLTARFDSLMAIVGDSVRPPGVMGASYDDTLHAAGGSGVYVWQKLSGNLPPGVSLGTNGRLSGVPAATGTFSFSARVTSGPQTRQGTYTITVAAPTLVEADVVSQLLHGTGLTADEQRYLDLLGNKNGFFDVGDFAVWVQATGAVPQVAAGTVARARRP